MVAEDMGQPDPPAPGLPAEPATRPGPVPVTVIRAGRTRVFPDLAELWRHREVVYFLVWRNLKVKYRQTHIGVAWVVLQPLITVAVFTFIFGRLVGVPTGDVPYALFALAGLVPWNYFASTVNGMTSSLVDHQEMIRRVYFPRLAIPLAILITALVDLAIGFVIIALALVVFGVVPPIQAVLLPFFLLQMMATALGIGLFVSASNVRYRDVGYIVPFAVQTLLFLTPVVYPSDLLPAAVRPVAGLNPMAGVLEGLRWCLFDTPPSFAAIALSLAVTAALLAIGLAWFARTERGFADVI